MKKFYFLLMFLLTLSFYGQNLKSHQWKNRVLVIYSEDSNSEILKNQLDLFSDKKSEIKERKLIIYQVSKNQFKTGFSEEKWTSTKTNFFKFRKSNFTINLIGLDGGIKLQQNALLKPEVIFSIIDGMPMRKRELKSKI